MAPSFVKVEWIFKLNGLLSKINQERNKEIDRLKEELFLDPQALAKYYVPGDCQPVCRFENGPQYRQATVEVVNAFLSKKTADPGLGKNVLFVLAGTGLGKTWLLGLLHMTSWTSFWPKSHFTHIEKLGPDTIGSIRRLKNKASCILLLDALDEDNTLQQKTITDRLEELLSECKSFFRVIFTCRTQFFPANIERGSIVELGSYRANATYLSDFDDAQIRKYLSRRYSQNTGFQTLLNKLFGAKTPEHKRAEELVALMGPMSSRPLLLAYLEDIIGSAQLDPREKSDQTTFSTFDIYSWLIEGWLRREQGLHRGLDKERLFKASLRIASCLHSSKIGHRRMLSKRELSTLQSLHNELGCLSQLDLKGRALLNRDANGDFRFAHFSIQEFLLSYSLIYHPDFVDTPVRGTRMLVEFLLSKNTEANVTALRAVRLEGLDLSGLDFSNRDLSGIDFKNTKLDDTNFRGSTVPNSIHRRARSLERSSLLEEFPQVGFLENSYFLPDEPELGFVFVPEGEFIMGTNTEERKDRHSTFISDFWLARYPVTEAQYQVYLSETGRNRQPFPKDKDKPGDDPDLVAINITWNDAISYCDWLESVVSPDNCSFLYEKIQEGWKICLPSEGEWEKAARGVDGRTYTWGEQEPDDKLARAEPHRVGTVFDGRGPYGHEDMLGLAWEWTRSPYSLKYPFRESAHRPSWILSHIGNKALRGGALKKTPFSQSEVRTFWRRQSAPEDTLEQTFMLYHHYSSFRLALVRDEK